MEVNQKEVVLLSYPFSDLVGEKVRPAIVISNNVYNKRGEDVIVVPLTTNLKLGDHSILISTEAMETGTLIKESRIKVDRIFSVKKSLIRFKVGRIKNNIYEEIIKILGNLVK